MNEARSERVANDLWPLASCRWPLVVGQGSYWQLAAGRSLGPADCRFIWEIGLT